MPGAIDFNAMYSRCDFNRKDGDILSQINKLSNEDDKRRAHEIIIEEEIKGMERMQLREHLNLLFNTLNYYNIKVAISTRNNEEALSYFLEKSNLDRNQFSHLLHRDSIKIEGKSINKPDARVALHVLEDWNLENESVWFVGDSDDDINCGISAGMNTCLIRTNYNSHLESEVTVAVDDLIDFAKHLKIL
jgi:phosphoglycolate phosphatase-like HAD superfamily hydrolase